MKRIVLEKYSFSKYSVKHIVANDQLVEILEENKPVPSDKAYTRWELTTRNALILANKLVFWGRRFFTKRFPPFFAQEAEYL